jgi:hypothetical protein
MIQVRRQPMKPAAPAREGPGAALARAEAESEALFKQYRAAYYRRIAGDLKTDRALDAARESMEAAVIRAGNAYVQAEKPLVGVHLYT